MNQTVKIALGQSGEMKVTETRYLQMLSIFRCFQYGFLLREKLERIPHKLGASRRQANLLIRLVDYINNHTLNHWDIYQTLEQSIQDGWLTTLDDYQITY